MSEQKKEFEERLKKLEERVTKLEKMREALTKIWEPLLPPTYDMKLEELRQAHDLDMQKLHWEQKKFRMQQDAEKEKWERIQETFRPILDMASPEIKNAVEKAGEMVLASTSKPETASFTCPKCNTALNVPIPPGTEEVNVKCPKCGTVTPSKVEEKTLSASEMASPEIKTAMKKAEQITTLKELQRRAYELERLTTKALRAEADK